jgi:hypothetical protein
MNALILLFFASLLLGQLGGIPVDPGVTLYLHDFAAVAILGYGIITGAIRRSMTGSRLVAPIVAFVIVGLLSLLVNAPAAPIGTLWKGSLYLLRWVGSWGVRCSCRRFGILCFLCGDLFWGRAWVAGLFQFVSIGLNLMYLGWDRIITGCFRLFDPNLLISCSDTDRWSFYFCKKDIWVIGAIGGMG